GSGTGILKEGINRKTFEDRLRELKNEDGSPVYNNDQIETILRAVDKGLKDGKIVISPRQFENLGELLHNRIFSDQSGFNAFSRVMMAYLEVKGIPVPGKDRNDSVPVNMDDLAIYAQHVLPHETQRSTGADALHLAGRVLGLSATLGDSQALLQSIGSRFWQIHPEAKLEDMNWRFQIESQLTTRQSMVREAVGHDFDNQKLLILNSVLVPKMIAETGEGTTGFINSIKNQIKEQIRTKLKAQGLTDDQANKQADQWVKDHDIKVIPESNLKNGFKDLAEEGIKKPTIVFTSMREGVSVEVKDVQAMHVDFSVRSLAEQLQSMGRLNVYKDNRPSSRTRGEYKLVINTADDPNLTSDQKAQFNKLAELLKSGNQRTKSRVYRAAEDYLVNAVMRDFSRNKSTSSIVQTLQDNGISGEKISEVVSQARKGLMLPLIEGRVNAGKISGDNTVFVPLSNGARMEVQLNENRNFNAYREVAIHAANNQPETSISEYAKIQQGQVYDKITNSVWTNAQWNLKPEMRGTPVAAVKELDVPIPESEMEDFSPDAPKTEPRMVLMGAPQHVVEGNYDVVKYDMPLLSNGEIIHVPVTFKHNPVSGQWELDKELEQNKHIVVPSLGKARVEEATNLLGQHYFRFFKPSSNGSEELIALGVEGHLLKLSQEAAKKEKQVFEIATKKQVFFGPKRGYEYVRGKNLYRVDFKMGDRQGMLIKEGMLVTNREPIHFDGITIQAGDQLFQSRNNNGDNVWEVRNSSGTPKALIVNDTAAPLVNGRRAVMARDSLRLVMEENPVDGKPLTVEVPTIHEYVRVMNPQTKQETWEPAAMVVDTDKLKESLGILKGDRIDPNSGVVTHGNGKIRGIYYKTFFYKPVVKEGKEIFEVSVGGDSALNKYRRNDMVGLGLINENYAGSTVDVKPKDFIDAVASVNRSLQRINALGELNRQVGEEDRSVVIK
ncbi:MAG: hypothetical protein KGJ11_08490, partial [Candidatus Omnitrophica bacterium]|nr:hypothetical protein [Candidatus Omnitrophota bacterium]